MAERRVKAGPSGGDGRIRAIIDSLSPTVDGGRFPAKRIAGEPVRIEAHCFADGHEKLRVTMRWGALEGPASARHETDMAAQGNDVWIAEFTPPEPGRYRCEISAWVDHFESWRDELERREDIVDIRIALQVGAALALEAAARARGNDADGLSDWASLLSDRSKDESVAAPDLASLKALALDPARASLVAALPRSALRRRRRPRDCGGPQARRSIELVRIVSPLFLPGTHASRKFQGRRGSSPLRRRHGLRRALLAAHTSHRARQPQGRQQRARGEARRRRESLGHRIRGGRPQADLAGIGDLWRISGAAERPGAESGIGDRARHCVSSAPPIIRT